MWGDGTQTRSFLYIDECVEGTIRLTRSDFTGPVNIGSEEMVSINEFAAMIMAIAGKQLRVRHVAGPTGVRGRMLAAFLLLVAALLVVAAVAVTIGIYSSAALGAAMLLAYFEIIGKREPALLPAG